MNKRTVLTLASISLLGLLGGCATSATPNYDAKFGEAVRQARALQTMNPEAGKSTDPVAGIDGESGKNAIDQYQESFKTPPKAFDILNIGGALQSQ